MEEKVKKKFYQSKVFWIIIVIIVIAMVASSGNNDKYKSNPDVEVTLADFSKMNKSEVTKWADEHKVNVDIKDTYSNDVKKGGFISQSIVANATIHEGDKVTVEYSLGKKPTTEEKNALAKAELYSETMYMSKQGIYDQLVSSYGEGFSKEAAQYAIDNIEADWNKNALEKAKTYRDTMNMSKKKIYEQLKSKYGEKFTKKQAQYAIDHLDD